MKSPTTDQAYRELPKSVRSIVDAIWNAIYVEHPKDLMKQYQAVADIVTTVIGHESADQEGEPKDGMLPDSLEHALNSLLAIVMHTYAFEDDPDKKARQVERNATAVKEYKTKLSHYLITAATNEKLPASGDEDLRKRLAIFQNYTASWGFPMNQEAHYKGLDIVEADMQKIINTAKQTAVAEERLDEIQQFRAAWTMGVNEKHPINIREYIDERSAALRKELK